MGSSSDMLKQKDNNNSLWCGYKNQLRRVHPRVCKWHMEENDPECAGCDPAKRTNVKCWEAK